eukprot:5925528-Pyramimonas_sp.AAC.1
MELFTLTPQVDFGHGQDFTDSFQHPLRICLPCVGVDGRGAAFSLMNISVVGRNAMDIETSYAKVLERHFGAGPGPPGPSEPCSP